MPDSCKFCTNCGTKLQVTSPNITNATYDTDNKDCASEKKYILEEHHLETNENNHIAQWNIGKSEIARRISEIDFVNIGTISSILIQPGVTAVIYIDGKEILQLNSGIYRFAPDTVVN